MKIETTEWRTLAEVCGILGMSQSTCYRLSRDMGVVHVFFGVKCVHGDDVARMQASRRRVGNQRWIASSEEAASDALKSVKSRKKRIKASGHTDAEVLRNRKLAVIGSTKGGRRTGTAKRTGGAA